MPKNPQKNQVSTEIPRRKSECIIEKSSKKLNNQENPQQKDKKTPRKKEYSVSSSKQIEGKKGIRVSAKVKRPEQLTSNIFSSLYNNPTRIQGYLQMIEWRKKRQNLYSVRLSDGFFRIKTFAKGEVAKLLAKNAIKQFYILNCIIDFQGDKICELKSITKVHPYGFSIGFTQPWKFDKLNLNPLGSNQIDWSKWDKYAQHSNQDEQKIPNPIHIPPFQQTNPEDLTTIEPKQTSSKITQSITVANPRLKKQKQKTPNAKSETPKLIIEYNLKNLSPEKHQKMLVKPKSKQKVLQLSSHHSSDSSQSDHQPLKKQSFEALQRTQSLNVQYKITAKQLSPEPQSIKDDSWQDFFDEFIIFKQQKDHDAKKKENLTKIQNKFSKQLLQQLFEDSESDSTSKPQSFNQKQNSNSKLLKQQSQTFSPQPPKSKRFPFELFEDTQPASDFNPVAITEKSPSKEKLNKCRPQNQQNPKPQKITLKWISNELSNIKKNDSHKLTKTVFQQIFGQVQKQSEQKNFPKPQHIYSNHKKINNNFNQFLIQAESPLKVKSSQNQVNRISTSHSSNEKLSIIQKPIKIIEIQDLIQGNILQYINLAQFKDFWALKVKILHLDNVITSKNNTELSFIKRIDKKCSKDIFIKCLAVSEDYFHLCSIMITKQAFQKYELIENQCYLIRSPKIIQKKEKNSDSQNKNPDCMLNHWVEVTVENQICKLQKKLTQKTELEQEWLDSLHEIEEAKNADVMNVMGYVKSVKQNSGTNGSNSMLDGSSDDTNSNCYSMKSKNVKANTSKNRSFTQVEVIDPFTGYIVQFTDFNPSEIKPKQYSPIIIFMAEVHIYRNKKSLISKPDTIIVYNKFLPTVKISRLLAFQSEHESRLGEVLENMQVQLVGYHRASDILEASEYEQNAKVHLEECEIFSMGRISYMGCVYCHKKILNGECPGCGACSKEDIIERVLFVGVVADSTGSFKFFLDKQTADKALNEHTQVYEKLLYNSTDGPQREGKHQFEEQNPWKSMNPAIQQLFTLERVELWFTLQGEDKPITIDKISRVRNRSNLKQLLEELSEIPIKSQDERQQFDGTWGNLIPEQAFDV